MNYTAFIVNIFSGYLQLILQGLVILSFYNKKFIWKRLLLFATINVIANEAPRYLLPEYFQVFNIVVYLAVLIVTTKLILTLNIRQSILGAACLLLLATVMEYIVIAMSKVSTPGASAYSDWMKSQALPIVYRNIGNLFLAFTAIVIKYLKMQLVMKEDIAMKKMLGISINIFIAIIIVVPNMLYFQHSSSGVPTEVIAFNALSVLSLVILSIYNTLKSEELEMKTQKLEFYEIYNKSLKELLDSLRGFKHDFGNMVQVMNGYIQLGNIEGLKQYFSQLQAETRFVNNTLPVNTYLQENPAIYGLILSKVSLSELKDIKFEVNITTDLNINSIKIYDLCRILGILLDNAIEATEVNEKKLVIFTVQKDRTNALMIEVGNSFSGEVDVEKIFNEGFSTKKDHTGYGLYEVKKLISKYGNMSMNTNIYGNMLFQIIKINV